MTGASISSETQRLLQPYAGLPITAPVPNEIELPPGQFGGEAPERLARL